ncbi:MAG: hypothetical protein M5U12_09230 [Verrucomicrobia bacterium]|nr:hypothetical protein [Verrucomicrobiota bacterium]
MLLRHTWERAKLFLTKAGTVILGFNILLWFLASYPRPAEIEARFESARTALIERASPGESPAVAESREAALAQLERELAGERIRHSYAGWLGHAIEPLIRPLGFDWKMGIGIVTSFAAREIFVSTMSVVYSMGGGDSEAEVGALATQLKDQKHPDGTPVYTTLTGLTLMVFYVVALQCASTVAVVRRETNSWRWPLFQWAYLGVLAWCLAFLTHWAGRALGMA